MKTAIPISYSIDAERGVIFETWVGKVSAEDLRRYWTVCLADPEALAIRRTLVDLRKADITFSGEELSRLIRTVALPLAGDRGWKSAIVTTQPVQFGVSRQYHVFAESFSSDAIFDDYDAALEWLLRQQ